MTLIRNFKEENDVQEEERMKEELTFII